ncbi:MAG: exosome complex component, partial [Thermoproteota archaeon]|nr:exosome complex component [Thermoproteota archaeon]
LPIQNYPVEVTMAKIENKMVVDPSLEEEGVTEAQITIAVGQNDEICAIQKSKPGSLTQAEVLEAANTARKKAREIREKILEGMKSE